MNTIREVGNEERKMGPESASTKEIAMRESTETIKGMALEFIIGQVETDMKGNGIMVLDMVLEPISGMMVTDTKANGEKV